MAGKLCDRCDPAHTAHHCCWDKTWAPGLCRPAFDKGSQNTPDPGSSKTTDPSFTQFLDLKDWVRVSKTSVKPSHVAMLSLPNPWLKECPTSTRFGVLQLLWDRATLVLLPSHPSVLHSWATRKPSSSTAPRRTSAHFLKLCNFQQRPVAVKNKKRAAGSCLYPVVVSSLVPAQAGHWN